MRRNAADQVVPMRITCGRRAEVEGGNIRRVRQFTEVSHGLGNQTRAMDRIVPHVVLDRQSQLRVTDQVVSSNGGASPRLSSQRDSLGYLG